MTRRSMVFPLLVLGVIFITWRLSYTTFAWVPVPLFLGSLIAHTIKKPLRWLAALAVLGELFTVLPFGVMTAAIFLPWGGRRVAHRMETDFSLWFFLYLLTVTGAQVLVICLASMRHGWQFFPWPAALVSTLATSGAVFALLIIRLFSLPSVWPR